MQISETLRQKHEEIKQTYALAKDRRPWIFEVDNPEEVKRLIEKWLLERGGVVVYENITMDSSCLGDRSMLPAIVDMQQGLQCAPTPRWNIDGNFSTEMQQVDYIELSEDNMPKTTGLMNGTQRMIDSCFDIRQFEGKR